MHQTQLLFLLLVSTILVSTSFAAPTSNNPPYHPSPGDFAGVRAHKYEDNVSNRDPRKRRPHPGVVVEIPSSRHPEAPYKIAMISKNLPNNPPQHPIEDYQQNTGIYGNIALKAQVVKEKDLRPWKNAETLEPQRPLSPGSLNRLQKAMEPHKNWVPSRSPSPIRTPVPWRSRTAHAGQKNAHASGSRQPADISTPPSHLDPSTMKVWKRPTPHHVVPTVPHNVPFSQHRQNVHGVQMPGNYHPQQHGGKHGLQHTIHGSNNIGQPQDHHDPRRQSGAYSNQHHNAASAAGHSNNKGKNEKSHSGPLQSKNQHPKTQSSRSPSPSHGNLKGTKATKSPNRHQNSQVGSSKRPASPSKKKSQSRSKSPSPNRRNPKEKGPEHRNQWNVAKPRGRSPSKSKRSFSSY